MSTVMCSWADRVDGGIRNGQLYFAFYKNERSSGKVTFPDPKHWFDGNSMAGYRGGAKPAP